MSAQGKHINGDYWDPSDVEYVPDDAASEVWGLWDHAQFGSGSRYLNAQPVPS